MDMAVRQFVDKNTDQEAYEVYRTITESSDDKHYEKIATFGSIYEAFHFVMDKYRQYNEKLELQADMADSQRMIEQQ